MCVPLHDEDIAKTVTSLPRSLDQSHLIPIKFKRMKQMKNTHAEAFVRPAKLLQALKAFKEAGNPHYRNVTIDVNFEDKNDGDNKDLWNALTNRFENLDEVQDKVDDKVMTRDDSSEDEKTIEKDPIKAFQTPMSEITCMVPRNPEVDVVINTSKTTKKVPVLDTTEKTDPSLAFELAPGEGKIPTNFVRAIDWDVKAYPCYHRSGKYGLDYEREEKVSTVEYIKQRLMNKDDTFANDPSYIFASQQRLEHENLEKH